jgi:glucokinase
MVLLAGDVGATKTRLALYERKGKDRYGLERRLVDEFQSTSAASLEEIVRNFLRKYGATASVEAACIGIPGPVVAGTVRATNLPWVLHEKTLGEGLKIRRVKLVNDLAAHAAALPFLRPEDLVLLHPGNDDRERRVFAVLAPGTGLGQAYLYLDDSGRYHPFPSEGGHAEFAPRNDVETDLLRYLRQKLQGRVSIERVLSGPGLVNIYSFLRDRSYCEVPEALREEIAAAQAPAAIIGDYGESGKFEICVKALDIFVGLLGSRAGDLVLTYLSTGGMFLGGGIPPKILKKLQEGGTVAAYLDKGRLSTVVESTPLQVIKDDQAALLGAASIAAAL